MATLTLKIKYGDVNNYVKETKERFESNPLTNLLINANICIFKDKEGELIIFHVRPMVSSFLLLVPAVIFGIAIFVLGINPYLYIISGIYIAIILAFYSDYFLYLIYLWGLKKANIEAEAERVNRDELIRRMVLQYESRKPKARTI